MLLTEKFADLHVHTPCPDIDKTRNMMKELSDFGVKNFNMASITFRGYSVDDNIITLYLKETFKEAAVSVFGGLYYSPYLNYLGVPFSEQAQRLLDMGCDGLKLIEAKPTYRKAVGFGLDSKLYDDMFCMLEEKQIPLLCHALDPVEFWYEDLAKKLHNWEYIKTHDWMYDKPEFLTHSESRNEVLARLQRNPNLNIVFAHFMFLSEEIELAEELMEKYPNFKLDLTPGWEMYVGFMKNYDAWKKFFEKYSTRILYGTDTHNLSFAYSSKIHQTVRYAVAGESDEITMPHVPQVTMRGFDLSKEHQENIFYNNYQRLIGTPKKVNVDLLVEEAENMLRLVKSNDNDQECIARLERIIHEIKA